MGLAETVLWIVLSLAVGAVYELIQFRYAGRLAQEWASERNLRVVEYKWRRPWAFEPDRYARYHIVVEDIRGHRTEALACFSGLVRRKFWVDFSGSGRGWRPSS